MKNDTTTTFLNFVLIALVILGVLFGLMTMWKSRLARHIATDVQLRMPAAQATGARAQQLLNDVMAYYGKSPTPELNQIIRDAQTPPAPAK
jgi:hypothetical protein